MSRNTGFTDAAEDFLVAGAVLTIGLVTLSLLAATVGLLVLLWHAILPDGYGWLDGEGTRLLTWTVLGAYALAGGTALGIMKLAEEEERREKEAQGD